MLKNGSGMKVKERETLVYEVCHGNATKVKLSFFEMVLNGKEEFAGHWDLEKDGKGDIKLTSHNLL